MIEIVCLCLNFLIIKIRLSGIYFYSLWKSVCESLHLNNKSYHAVATSDRKRLKSVARNRPLRWDDASVRSWKVLLLRALTVKPEIKKVAIAEIVLHDCHKRGHLAKQQDSVVGGLQLWQDAVEELKLSRSAIQLVTSCQESKHKSWKASLL